MKYRVVFETKIELDESDIKWTEDGEKEFFGPRVEIHHYQPIVNLDDVATDWQLRYLTMCLDAANSAAAGGNLEGTLSFGTARLGYTSNGNPTTEPVDAVDIEEDADLYFHEIFGTIGYRVIEELHFGDNPVEGTD
jgi:hypothetical protein